MSNIDKHNKGIHIIPLKLRISINEDHAALDSIIHEYSKKMGMSMTTFITEVLLDVLLEDRTVGVFRNVNLNLNCEDIKAAHSSDNNISNSKNEYAESNRDYHNSVNDIDAYNNHSVQSIVDMDEEL